MITELQERIKESLKVMDKLIYFIDDKCFILGFKNLSNDDGKVLFDEHIENLAVTYFNDMDSIAVKASEGLSREDESLLFKSYSKLKQLLANCDVKIEKMIKIIDNCNENQLEQIIVQIKVYNVMRDLYQGKNLIKKPESLKDYIFYVLECDKPSGNYPAFEDSLK